jgi:HSP20 family protein
MALVRFTNPRNQGVNHFVNDFFAPFATDSFLADRQMSRIPAVNISESSEAYHIDLAAPGLDKNDFKVQIENDVIAITVEKENIQHADGLKFNKREFSYTSFTRSFSLPENADQGMIEAKYNEGVLQVMIAKKVSEKPVSKQIEIQ